MSLIGLVQRVNKCSVTVEEKIISSIGKGLLILLGIHNGDRAVVQNIQMHMSAKNSPFDTNATFFEKRNKFLIVIIRFIGQSRFPEIRA